MKDHNSTLNMISGNIPDPFEGEQGHEKEPNKKDDCQQTLRRSDAQTLRHSDTQTPKMLFPLSSPNMKPK